jgi:hypothetical protein
MVTQEAGFRIQCPNPLGTDLRPLCLQRGHPASQASRVGQLAELHALPPIGQGSYSAAFSQAARRLFVWRLSDALQKDQEFDAPDVLTCRETRS